MYYSPGLRFQTSLGNMDEAKSLTKKNQLEKLIIFREDGASVAPPSTYKLTQMVSLWSFFYQKAKHLALEIGISLSETKKSAEYAVEEEYGKFLVA